MPTPALTDLQRIELAFPAAVMLHVLDHAADAVAPRVRQVRRLLASTIDKALGDVTVDHRRKLRSRLDRALRVFLSPLARVRGRVDVVGLTAWRVLEAVLDADVLILPEGAPLSIALDTMQPALQRAASDPRITVDVARAWPAALYRLQAIGLYREVGGGEVLAA